MLMATRLLFRQRTQPYGGNIYIYGVVEANVPDCDIQINELRIQSGYYVDFPTNALTKCMKPLISFGYGLQYNTLFYKNGFGIK